MRCGLVSRGRPGSVLPLVTVGLLAILAVAALALDVTRLHIAAQRAQAIADSAALAGVAGLPEVGEAEALAIQTVEGNNAQVPEWQAELPEGEGITYYPPGSTIMDREGEAVLQLGDYATAIGVQARVRVNYAFAPVLGLHDGFRTRSAVAVQGPAGGICAVPIWISEDSNPGFGQPMDLLYDDLKKVTDIPPGSFGFLDFSTPGQDWFQQLLRGYNVAPEVQENAIVHVGDIVNAYTGVNTGSWLSALTDETGWADGTSRMERAADEPWSGQSFEDHWPTNPLIMLVPVVQYLSGTGNNAEFRVHKFAVFWLDGAGKVPGGSNHRINARFIEFQYSPDAYLDPQAPDSGIYARKLIL